MTEVPKRGRKPNVMPGAQVLSDHELTGLFAEAFEAYDMRGDEMGGERVRFDSKNRRWVFVMVTREHHAELLLKCQRGQDIREDFISSAVLATEHARHRIQTVVRGLDGTLA